MKAPGRNYPRRLLAGGVLLSVALPFVPLVLWAFSSRWFYPQPWPQAWGLRAWEYIFNTAGSQIIPGLMQSVWVAGLSALLAVALGLPAGRALGLYHFRGKQALAVLLTLPVVVPPLCVAMGLHLWFIRLGLTETLAGVVLIHSIFCLPYAVFVLWGVFANYDPDFEDQARSLGAGPWRTWYCITLPMVLPGVVVAGLFAFLLSWSQYLSTLIIGGGRVVTLPILLFALMGSGDRPVAAAVSLVFVLPALLILLISARCLGLRTATGVP